MARQKELDRDRRSPRLTPGDALEKVLVYLDRYEQQRRPSDDLVSRAAYALARLPISPYSDADRSKPNAYSHASFERLARVPYVGRI